jgi:beta-glucanase (GH16 family)
VNTAGRPPVSTPTPPQPTGPGAPGISETGGIPAGFHLAWSDEFDVAGLPDAAKWGYDIERNSAGWYNNELQDYGNARLENSRVENGMLVITARREDLSTQGLSDWSGQQYSSARLITRDKASWTYGFMEVRAKLPCGVGTWPAVWTLSVPPQTSWPDDGEIDIMSTWASIRAWCTASAHGAYNHARQSRTATTNIPDACNEFHRYQMAWSASRITVGVDDRNYYQYSNDGSRCRVALRKPAVPDPQRRRRRRLAGSRGQRAIFQCRWKSTTCASTSRNGDRSIH